MKKVVTTGFRLESLPSAPGRDKHCSCKDVIAELQGEYASTGAQYCGKLLVTTDALFTTQVGETGFSHYINC